MASAFIPGRPVFLKSNGNEVQGSERNAIQKSEGEQSKEDHHLQAVNSQRKRRQEEEEAAIISGRFAVEIGLFVHWQPHKKKSTKYGVGVKESQINPFMNGAH